MNRRGRPKIYELGTVYATHTPLYFRIRRMLRRAHGACYNCGDPAVTGRRLCERCSRRALVGNRSKYTRRRIFRVCFRCGKRPVGVSGHSCQACRDAMLECKARKRRTA